MKNIKHFIYIGILALCVAAVSSCSDDEEYDFTGDKYNRVYLQDHTASYKVVTTPISVISDVSYETVVRSSRIAGSEIKVTVEIDNSMIDDYNTANETEYEAMDASVINLENTTLTIPAGGSVSSDTLRVALTENESVLGALDSESGYLIPLRITTVSGGDAEISTNVNGTYVIVTLTEDNVNHDATEEDINGTLVADQSGWSATTTASYTWDSWYPLYYMFDGNASNYAVVYDTAEYTIDVDMGQEYTFDAVYMVYGYWSYTFGTFETGMSVSTSDDGQTWTKQGECESSGTFVAFYAPVTARYVRVTAPENTYYMYVGIFNVYAL